MIPEVPAGCTLRSVVNAMLYLRGDFFSSLATRSDILAAQAVALELLEGRRNALWVATRFTILPLIVGTLAKDRESSLLSNLAARKPIEVVIEKAQAMMPREFTQFRICRLCVEADHSQYGLAFTRVLHQIRGIKTCSLHNQVLENACGDCGEKYYWVGNKSRRMVPGRCRSCRSEKGLSVKHAQSAGYAAFSDILTRGLVARAPEVRPDGLQIALDRFAQISMIYDDGLLGMLSRFWGVDSWVKASRRMGAQPEEIRRSLLFGDPPATVLGAYGLASFFHSVVKNDAELMTADVINATIWGQLAYEKR